MTAPASTVKPGGIPRRHDLDALRSIAMLLGIFLHTVTYMPDTGSHVAAYDFLHQLIMFVHGFRMPVFFVMSGFFTAMLWRKRGLRSMLVQRFKRIFIPLALTKFLIFSFVRLFLLLAFVLVVPHDFIATAEANDLDTLQIQITSGIDVNAGANFRTALHAAVNAGNIDAAEVLLEAGADVQAQNFFNQTPLDIAHQHQDTTMLALLAQYEPPVVEADPIDAAETDLNNNGFFGYLWFLWFLCWLVVGFAITVTIGERLHWRRLPDRWVTTPLHYAWLVPLTLLFQMMNPYPQFGPGLSIGFLPVFHVLGYYAIFFGFGAVYFHYRDDHPYKRTWWVEILIACLMFLPLFNASMDGAYDGWRVLPLLGQALFTWLMVFGLMKLFHRFFSSESKRMRYISDSSYWQYLAHLPVMFLIQLLLPVSMHPFIRVVIVSAITVAFLLVTYEYLVRYRWIGRLLNGPRYRKGQAPSPASPPVAEATK